MNKPSLKIRHWVACVLALAGCTGEMEMPGPWGEGNAGLRVMHLSPDAPAVDVYVDGTTAFSRIEFTEGTDYATVAAGAHDLAVTPAGGLATDVVLAVDGAELREGSSYTAIAFDNVEAPIAALLVADAITTVPDDKIRMRAIHAAVGIGEVDLWSVPDMGEPDLLYENVGFGTASEALDLPPGTHRLGVDADNDARPDLIFDMPDLSAGIYVNLFAVTDSSGAPFLLAELPGGITARVDPRPTGPSSGHAEVRVVHLSPGSPDVDVFVDGEPAFSDVTFTWGTSYAELPAGSYRFDVSAAGTGAADAVLSVDGVPLAEGKSYTVVAYDRLDAPIKALALEDDYEDLAAGNIRVRAVHGAVGVGPVDVWTTAAGVATRLYDDLEFGTAGDYLDVPAGAYTLSFDVDENGIADVSFDVPGLVSGTVATVFDAGALFLLAQLRDGNTVRIAPSTSRTTGQVRVLHLSPDAPPVDVFANLGTTPIISALAFGAGTGYAALPATSYRFDVSATGTPAASSVLSVESLPIAAGGSYTVVAFDRLASIRGIALEDDFAAIPAGSIRVRAVHTASGIGQVDVLNVPAHGIAGVLFENLDFGAATSYADVPEGAYVIGLDLDDNRVSDALFRLPHLPAGTVANVFAVADSSAVYLVAQLGDGTVARIDASH
jgi:hypothetical protein